MNNDAIRPIIEGERASATVSRPFSIWPGWARRRIVMSYYFSGQFIALLAFALYLKARFPLYTEVHNQLAVLQGVSALIAVIWFVPAFAGDFLRAVASSSSNPARSRLSSAVWPLAKNVLYLGSCIGSATLPFVVLFPVSEIVGRYYYTDSYQLTWGVHVLIASFLLSTFVIGASSIAIAALLIIRSLIVYRLIVTMMILTSLMHSWLAYNLLAGSGLVFRYRAFQGFYYTLGKLNFPGFFNDFCNSIDGGSFLLNHIPSTTGKILAALALKAAGAGLLLVVFLWIGASLSIGLSMVMKGKAEGMRRRPVARPTIAFITGVLALGLTAAMLLHNTSYLMVTSYRTGAGGTPYDLMLLAIVAVIAYLAVSASADAVQSSAISGLGDSIATVVWRFQRNGTGLMLALCFVGAAYLTLFAKISGYKLAVYAASLGILLLAAAVVMTVATGVLTLSRLTNGFWGVAPCLQSFVITLGAAISAFFLFIRSSPETLISAGDGDPAIAAAMLSNQTAKLAGSTYPALVHSWLRMFEAGSVGGLGLAQLALTLAAVVIALTLALALISRLTRRLA